jgi:G3E family GTPase
VKRIREINSLAPILKTERSRVPLDEILNINAFDMQRAIEIDPHVVEDCEKHV